MENTTNNNNNTNNSNEIDSMMESVRTVFTATQTLMASMTLETRMPIQDMSAMIGTRIGIEPKRVHPFVHYMCHTSKLGYVSSGRSGGFIRGEKKLKTAKIQTSSPAPSQNTITSIEDADNSNE